MTEKEFDTLKNELIAEVELPISAEKIIEQIKIFEKGIPFLKLSKPCTIGDGVKARALKTFPGDFSKAEYQDQTDGDHFYKTKTGRGEMPKYEGKMSDDDIWNVVNYMRTFKK